MEAIKTYFLEFFWRFFPQFSPIWKISKVYPLTTKKEEEEALTKIREIITPYNLEVELLPRSVMARGEEGDGGTYARIIILKGAWREPEELAEISTKISNRVSVKVLMQITPPTPSP